MEGINSLAVSWTAEWLLGSLSHKPLLLATSPWQHQPPPQNTVSYSTSMLSTLVPILWHVLLWHFLETILLSGRSASCQIQTFQPVHILHSQHAFCQQSTLVQFVSLNYKKICEACDFKCACVVVKQQQVAVLSLLKSKRRRTVWPLKALDSFLCL